MNRLKAEILQWGLVRRGWTTYRRRKLHAEYEERRDRYWREADARGLTYRANDVERDVRARLTARGHAPRRRALGAVHTFAFIPGVGWHGALLPDLRALGPVTHYDYAAEGLDMGQLWTSAEAPRLRTEMNARALQQLRAAHASHPVDWVFVYASGLEVERRFIERITEETGLPVVNMCLDDKQSWTGPPIGNQRTGQVDIASAFDLSWTSARVACEWYLVEGGRPVYMPEGFDAAACRPMKTARDLGVSFVGAAYGFRPDVISELRRHGIDVATFGAGWGAKSAWVDDQVVVFNRSVINLGLGGIGYSESLTNVKARDFEIPGTGGGVYLTSFNPDLAQHFVVGREILCYRNREELTELARWYLHHRDEADAVATAGRARCLREHRWLHRYLELCRILGIVDIEAAGTRPEGSSTSCASARP